jgi:hypothetical protein
MKKVALLLIACMLMSFKAVEYVNFKMVTLFIYNFARNIQWPQDNSHKGIFQVGVWGDTPFTQEAISYLGSKKINEQPIEIKQLSNMQEVNSCQMVFISPDKSDDIKKLAAYSASSSVLLVSLQESSVNNGLGITLFLDNQDHKMKFQLNESVLKNKNMKVSKALLDLSVR